MHLLLTKCHASILKNSQNLYAFTILIDQINIKSLLLVRNTKISTTSSVIHQVLSVNEFSLVSSFKCHKLKEGTYKLINARMQI